MTEAASFAKRMTVTYHVRAAAAEIDARAKGIAVEQSVEMPLAAITSDHVLRDIVGEVRGIRELAPGQFEVKVGLATATMGDDPGQLLNMLFGNTSMADDVALIDADIPAEMCERFGGPNFGIEGLRKRDGIHGRAFTCTALKPQGISAADLGALAGRMAAGGLDYIKDDHSLADQRYSPYADRVRACVKAVREANAATGFRTRYAPNVSGTLDAARSQIKLAHEEGIDTVLIEPMIIGLANFHALVKEFPSIAFMGHPSMTGGGRIAPPFLFGTLFRLLGADIAVYANFGGRFSYTPETCLALADLCRAPMHGLAQALPAPAGGMTLERVPELLDFYGPDTMLLIGGSLLLAKERLTDEASAFSVRVAHHFEDHAHG